MCVAVSQWLQRAEVHLRDGGAGRCCCSGERWRWERRRRVRITWQSPIDENSQWERNNAHAEEQSSNCRDGGKSGE